MKILAHILIHLTGFLITTVVIWMLVVGMNLGPLIAKLTVNSSEFGSFAQRDIGLFLCVSAMSWSLLFGIYHLFQSRRSMSTRSLKRTHGTAMTETLIAIPVLLMLIFGLVQMSLNYIGVILLDYGTFQAARTLWVWQPEAVGNRAGVSMGLAKEMAKIQAALAVTPSAPGDYFQNIFTGSGEFKKARATLLASQLVYMGNDMGADAETMILPLQAEDPAGLLALSPSMSRSLGASSFRLRSVRQFTFAYSCISVSAIDENGQIGARVSYSQYQSMPFVGRIFGGPAAVNARPGFYSTYERQFTLAKQFPANPAHP